MAIVIFHIKTSNIQFLFCLIYWPEITQLVTEIILNPNFSRTEHINFFFFRKRLLCGRLFLGPFRILHTIWSWITTGNLLFVFFAQIGFPFAQKIIHVKVLAIGRLTPKNTAIKSQLNKSPSSKFKHTHTRKFMENNEQKKNNRLRCEPVYDFIDGACHFIVGVDFLYVLEPTIKYNNYK